MFGLKKKSSKNRREKSNAEIKTSKEEVEGSALEQSFSDSGDFTASISTQELEEEEGLIFADEMVNGRPVIKGGNIEKLVERLTYHKHNDVKYVKAFMLTFRSFTTPSELLDLLIQRYNIGPSESATEGEKKSFENVIKVVRLRVFNIIKGWLNNGFYDFHEKELKETLLDFINNQMAKTMVNPAQSLLALIEKKENAAEKAYEHIFTGDPPDFLTLKLIPANKGTILAYHPTEIARQLTLIEYKLFSAIKPSECVGQNWMSKRKEELAPNILAMIHRFNFVSTWLSSEIVRCPDLTKRTQILKHVLDIADACQQLNNFNALMEVISGLNSSSIFRLKLTWAGLPKKYEGMFQEMRRIMSRDKSYKNFREFLHNQVNPPCIPYLGMYLTDLTFIEEGNKDKLPNGFINVTKRQQLARVISEIQTYQNTPYFLNEEPSIQRYLENTAEALPEQQCYALSLKREKRDGTVDEQTPDLPYGEMQTKSSYLFDKPDDDESIVYGCSADEVATTSMVTAATIVKIVERITHFSYLDIVFNSSFLMSYQNFLSAIELLDLLDNRFDMPQPANPSKQQMNKFQSALMIPIHLRIVNFLRTWLHSYPEDFITDAAFQEKFLEKIHAWEESNPLLKQACDGLRKTLEKKLMIPLPTPECRFIGFLHGSEEETKEGEKTKEVTLLDFDDELIAQQFTLIEQNFFSSIAPRELICSWELAEMQQSAPNVLAMKANFDITRRWAITEVLSQIETDMKYRNISILICVAEKLIELHNFSSFMSILSGVLFVIEKFPILREWLPNSVETTLDTLIVYYQNIQSLKEKEEAATNVPVIPFLDIHMQSLSDVAATPPKTGDLVNIIRLKQFYAIYQQFSGFRAVSHSFDYHEKCGGYLYRSKVWEQETIEKQLEEVVPIEMPLLRPHMDDIRNGVDQYGDMDENESEMNLSPRNKREGEALAYLRGHLETVITEESDYFDELLKDAQTNVANDMLNDLRMFADGIHDELAVFQAQFGLENEQAADRDQRQQAVLKRVFPGFTISTWTELDSEGAVYGWEDQVNVLKVVKEKEQFLVCMTPQLKKVDASNALRLFKFFGEVGSESTWKNVIVSSACSLEATSILRENGITLYDYYGEIL